MDCPANDVARTSEARHGWGRRHVERVIACSAGRRGNGSREGGQGASARDEKSAHREAMQRGGDSRDRWELLPWMILSIT